MAFGVEMSGFTSILMKWVMLPVFWLIIIVGFIIVSFISLYIRKRKRLLYKCIEVVDLGRNKCSANNLRAGYFGKKSMVKGLIWWGEEVLKTESGEIIHNFSTEDFQEIDGERGVWCYRDPLNQNILVPLNKVRFMNKELVADIAPASYRDVAIDIFNDAIKETTEWKEKLLTFAGWALVVIFSLIAIIVIAKMVESGQAKSAELLLNAGKEGAEACKQICANAVNIVASGNIPGGAP
jgi:hypothetical protein